MTQPVTISETRIMSYILAQLRERYPDALFERQNVVMAQTAGRYVRAGTVGQGDIRGCLHGRYLELEIKRPGAKQTPAQQQRQINVLKAGGIYVVIHSLEEALKVVESLTVESLKAETI